MPGAAHQKLYQTQTETQIQHHRGGNMKIIPSLIRRHIRRALLILGSVAAGCLPMASRAAAPVATSLGADTQALQAPARLTVDADGQLYVTEPQDGRVVVFDAFGRLASVKSSTAGPLGLAVDGTGQIFLAEEKTGSVSVFDPQWNLLAKLGIGDGEFALPNYIALDPAAAGGLMVYVTDSSANEVKAYQNGVLAFRFAGEGTNAFSFPAGICLSSAGELLIVDQNNDRIQVYDRNGGYLRQFTLVSRLGMGLGSAGGRSQGITSDGQGRLYVADSFQGFVRVFDTNGTYLSKIGSFGETPGKFRIPAGLALDAFNRLFVASLNNSRAEIFGLDSYLHFTTTAANNLLAEGTNVTLSVVAGGPGPFTFQWRRDGNNLSDTGTVSGATNATLSLSGVALADSGKYSVVVNNTVVSPGADLTVLTPPSFTQSPVSQTNLLGSDATFNVAADGSPTLAYQWRKDGQDLDGQTNTVLILNQVSDYSAGTYTVVVSNAVGTAAASALLTIRHLPIAQDVLAATTVNTPLVIPLSQLLLSASSPDQLPLSVSAVGFPGVMGASAVLRADSVTYTPVVDYQGTDSFAYSVSDSYGSTASAIVQVTVIPPSAAVSLLHLPIATGQGLELSLEGAAWMTYRLERTETLSPPAWTNLGQATVGVDGVALVVDPSPPPGGAFYRAVFP
jgi:sugar lactone lactonase YvrE